MKMPFNNFPATAWLVGSISSLLLSVGVCTSMVRSTNFQVELENLRIDSTAQYSQVSLLAKALKEQAVLMQEKDQAYAQLKKQIESLKNRHQPIKLLEPALEEMDRINHKFDLDEIESQLEKTAQEAESKIQALAEDKNSIPLEETRDNQDLPSRQDASTKISIERN